MKTKLIEVRDRMTFIPALAIEVSGADGALARRAGYGDRCIVFGKLSGGQFEFEPYNWRDRTMRTAHGHVAEHWDILESGARDDQDRFDLERVHATLERARQLLSPASATFS